MLLSDLRGAEKIRALFFFCLLFNVVPRFFAEVRRNSFVSSGRAYQLLSEWALPLAAVAAAMGVLAFGAENARRVPPDVFPPVPV